jgi:Replication initiator protein, pSAM2
VACSPSDVEQLVSESGRRSDPAAAMDEGSQRQQIEVHPIGHHPVVLGWGDQIDTRPITPGAGRDDQAGDVHPEMVAAYLAKYLTKSTEDFGLDGHGRVHSATDARCIGASPHALRIIQTAEQLVASGGRTTSA